MARGISTAKLAPLVITLGHNYNESTAGADASVEVPKLHNIKLLIASFYTHTHLS